MSEFDANPFSAIDKFFGGETENEKDDSERKGKNHPTRKRQGVGSSTTPAKTSQNELSKRLLMVGRKRQRGDDDDDDDDEDAGQKDRGRGSDDDDDDDEAGRTNIAKNKSTKGTSTSDRLTADSGPKKKLGKKERKKLQQGQEESDKKGQTDKKTDEQEVNGATEKGSTETNGGEEDTGKKHKRRKVRSKQKNIRKDNRDKKPEHLIVGRKKYQGRPLTAETRAKLSLPPPKARLVVHSPVQVHEDVHGTGLAIDDLLEDKGDHIETEEVSEKINKKRRKTKYKNLKL